MPSIPDDLLTPAEAGERAVTLGRWSLLLRGDHLDEIAVDGRRVLRGIRVVVRDADWRTPQAEVSRLEVSDEALTVAGTGSLDGLRYAMTLRVTAEGGVLTAEAEVELLDDADCNRAGLIVLLPADASGAPFRVTDQRGASVEGWLPERVAPHQPAVDIARLRWEPAGLEAELAFSGEVFEMEDQRNWTDASFKVYSTPLRLPFPVHHPRGRRLRQSLRLTAAHRGAAAPAPPTSAVLGLERSRDGRAPEIGVLASTAPDGPHPEAPASAAGVVLVEIDPREPQWRAALDRAVEDAAGRPIDLRLTVGDDGELIEPLRAAAALGGQLHRLGVFRRDGLLGSAALLRSAERMLDGTAAPELVGGTRAHFTELNRGAQALSDWPGALGFSITPTMHDLAGHQLVESLALQRTVRDGALAIADGRRLHVGPVTLRARLNAVATTGTIPSGRSDTAEGYGPEHVPGSTDGRQGTLAAASWLLASAAQLSGAGVASITLGEEWGPRGLGPAGTRAIEWLSRASGRPLLEPATGLPGVFAFGTVTADGAELVVSNLTADTLLVDPGAVAGCELLSGRPADVRGPEGDGDRIGIAPGDAARLLLDAAALTLRLDLVPSAGRTGVRRG